MSQPKFRAVTERRSLDNTGLIAALIGAVSTSVLLWANPAIVNGAIAGGWPATSWVNETNAANPAPGTGTTLKIGRRGIYFATLGITTEAAGAAAAFGISYNAPAATLLQTANPINGTAGIVVGQAPTTPAATQMTVNLPAIITVSDTDAGLITAGIIRFHGNDGAGGALADADLLQAVARYTVTYVGDFMGV